MKTNLDDGSGKHVDDLAGASRLARLRHGVGLRGDGRRRFGFTCAQLRLAPFVDLVGLGDALFDLADLAADRVGGRLAFGRLAGRAIDAVGQLLLQAL